MKVPCGKCQACRLRRATGWAFRLHHEERVSTSSYFVTLTYNDKHVRYSKNGFQTLHPPDVTNFFKSLRRKCSNKIKYYYCGEYGTRTLRPHYHIIIFNASEISISNSWLHDNIFIGSVNGASTMYTLKYMCKYNTIPLFSTDDREPEFSRMSKRLGLSYLTSQVVNYHICNEEFSVTFPSGHKAAMPRYFKDKVFNEYDKKAYSRKIAVKFSQDLDRHIEEAGGFEAYIKKQHEYYISTTKINKYERTTI